MQSSRVWGRQKGLCLWGGDYRTVRRASSGKTGSTRNSKAARDIDIEAAELLQPPTGIGTSTRSPF